MNDKIWQWIGDYCSGLLEKSEERKLRAWMDEMCIRDRAKYYGIPFYVLGPTSTIDMDCPTGKEIKIEERDPAEVTEKWYTRRMAPKEIHVYNPAFDVTSAELITAIITEKGIAYPPFRDTFLGWKEYKIKSLKLQRKLFRDERRELTQGEYERLLAAAHSLGRRRLELLIETICATGIRVSEVKYITMEAVQTGQTTISLKGKLRTILLPCLLYTSRCV